MQIQRTIKYCQSIIYSLLLLLGTSQVFAQEDPVQMLKSVTHQVLSELRSHRQELKRNPGKIYSVVNHIILPHVSFDESAKWVVGRNAWREADKETQETFIKEFKNLVVRSYAGSLVNYTDQEIEFLPLRSSGRERVEVSSIMKGSDKGPMRINYRLINSNGKWYVYDIIVEGVSLMQGYRAQFSEDVRRGGVLAVIEKIRSKNQKSDRRSR